MDGSLVENLRPAEATMSGPMSHTATCHLDPAHTHDRPELDARTREGLVTVGLSLLILGITTAAQVAVFIVSGSTALLADLTHNLGDALTAVPVGAAFLLQSARSERWAGYGIVIAIAISGVIAGVIAVDKLIYRETPDHLLALGLAGALSVGGNAIASRVRSRAGRKLDSPALIADGYHAKVDALVSAGVVIAAVLVGVGWSIADPLIALVITGLIGHITWEAWEIVRGRDHHN
jgi:cation diffusion facilitator family transporter